MKSVVALLPLALAACSTTSYMRDARPTPPPRPDQAKVVVYRTAAFGGADNYPVYDGDGTLLGFTETDCYFEILRPPGKHLFAALGEGEAMVEADLAAGKTYYIRAYSKFGLASSRPGLAPIRRETSEFAELGQVIPSLRCRALDPDKSAEFEARQKSRAMKALAGSEKAKSLRSDDGREEPSPLPAK